MAENPLDGRQRPLQQLQPPQNNAVQRPSVGKEATPVPPVLRCFVRHAILEVILAGNLSCRNAVLHKENFLPLPSNSNIPYSILS
jgi:hypothetical protein